MRLIYFIQAGPGGDIKIGISRNPKRRLTALQVAGSQVFVLLGVMEGDESTEQEIHAEFEAIRIRGEWFRCTDALMQYIDHNCDPTLLFPIW